VPPTYRGLPSAPAFWLRTRLRQYSFVTMSAGATIGTTNSGMVKVMSTNKNDQKRTLVNDDMLSIVSRISVVEYMVAQIFRMLYEQQGRTFDDIRKEHQEWLKLFMLQTFPEVVPANSDPIAWEMQASLNDLVVKIENLFERYSEIQKSGAT
jgi:hypothetical protein